MGDKKTREGARGSAFTVWRSVTICVCENSAVISKDSHTTSTKNCGSLELSFNLHISAYFAWETGNRCSDVLKHKQT